MSSFASPVVRSWIRVSLRKRLEQFRLDEWSGGARQWELETSAGERRYFYPAIRDEIRERVKTFLDGIE
jgi:hypothetical protein